MSDVVTLVLRAPISEPLDAASITPDRFGALGEAEIAKLPVWTGRRQQRLGDWFDVSGGRASRVHIAGDVRQACDIGASMTSGVLIIDGDGGTRTGAGMAGGAIEIHGSAADDLGAGMTGGVIHVRGDAGNRVGAGETGASRGMSGGEIIVDGSVGADAGARMRRGLVVVGGAAAERVGRAMIAGTVIVLGDMGAEPATGSKRGTLVVGGRTTIPPTYRYACTYDSPHVRLVLTHVRRRYGVTIDRVFTERPYRRFCGDAGTVGRGEILWLT